MPASDEPMTYRALAEIDVGMIATVRSNSEGGYYDPSDGSVIFIMDGESVTDEDSEPDPDERGWISIEADDSRARYNDMRYFADAITDPILADRISRAMDGRGAFRRFRNTLSEDDLYPTWARFSDAREEERVIHWLIEMEICDATECGPGLRAREDTAARALVEIADWRRD